MKDGPPPHNREKTRGSLCHLVVLTEGKLGRETQIKPPHALGPRISNLGIYPQIILAWGPKDICTKRVMVAFFVRAKDWGKKSKLNVPYRGLLFIGQNGATPRNLCSYWGKKLNIY